MKKSEIDKHPTAPKILELSKMGYANDYILKYCKSEGLELTELELIDYVSESIKEKKAKRKKHTPKTTLVVDLQEFSKRFDIPDDMSNSDAIMGSLQKLSAYAAIISYAITIKDMEDYLAGNTDSPSSDFIKNCKYLIENFCRLWGYDNAVNIATAIRTLESQGYKIDALDLLTKNGSSLELEPDKGDS